PTVRRRRGLPAAAGDRELPAAPGAAHRGRAADRDRPPGLQRHRAHVRQRARDGADQRHRRDVQLPPPRVLPDRGRHARSPARAVHRAAGEHAAGPAELRRSMRRALLVAAALGALALPAAAHAYSLPNADVAVRVASDGSLLVAEHITIEGAFHGAYRDIPLRPGESIDRIGVSERGTFYRRGGSTALGSIESPGTFNYESRGKRVRIVWHFQAAGEPRTFTVSYRFRGLAVAYDDV